MKNRKSSTGADIYENLKFTNDFMFCKVMTANRDLCKSMLELILQVPIRKIEYLEDQETLQATYDSKGVRLDVYVEDDAGTVYDVEMQTTVNKELPKRMRYYQGMIDMNLIEKNELYSKLKKSYIIFICLSDPFKADLPVYNFHHFCRQIPELELPDDAEKVIINAAGSRDGLSTEVAAFLDYLQTAEPKDEFTTELDSAVQKATENKEWRLQYMTLYMKYQEEREAGRQEGIQEGIQEGRKEEKLSAIRSLMQTLNLSPVQAMDALKISAEEQPHYLELLKTSGSPV